MVKNIDIFTPILDEPEIMGEIAAANVTNDVFALNVQDISGMLVFLGLKTNMPMEIAEDILIGIRNFMENKIDSKVLGGHTIYSEWPLIGGEASGFVDKSKLIKKNYVEEGDRLILTKPIGNQASMAAYRLQKTRPDLIETYSSTEVNGTIDLAIDLMIRPTRDVVETIHDYEDISFVHSMTDVSGFGLSGHLREMLQNSKLSAEIETIPYIRLTKDLAYDFGYKYDDALMPETAGGMLIAVDHDNAEDLSTALTRNGVKNWIIGKIDNVKPKYVRVSDDADHLEILYY